MILRQFLHTDPVIAASYLVGCAGKGAAVIVDPVDAPDRYIAAASEFGMTIRHVVDTHMHADHLSTGRWLSDATSAPYVLHRRVAPSFRFMPVADGDHLDVGNVRLDVLHVPGHTPEHIALLVTDHTRSTEPWLVLTGHTLMVGDMGRTELATSAEEGARALFTSAERLRRLPDHISVLPGAYAGSMCGRALSGTPLSTIGFERRHNRTFGITDEETFVAAMLRDIPPAPPDAALVRAANLGVKAA